MLSLPLFLEGTIALHISGIESIPYHPHEKLPKTDGSVLNIFPGYAAKRVNKVKEKYISPILHHIQEIWADNDPALYKYLLLWLAAGLQLPRQPLGVMPLVFGEHGGEGKGILLHWIARYIYGPHISYLATGLDSIVKYSGCLFGKVWVYIDELVRANTNSKDWYSTFDFLKTKITEPIIELRNLHSMPFQTNNYLRFFATSNNEHCIHYGGGMERRTCPMKASSKRVGDISYHRSLFKRLNQRAADHFYTYLLELVAPVEEVESFPKTKLALELELKSKSKGWHFIKACQDDSSIVIPYLKRKDEKNLIALGDLYNLFCDWCSDNRFEATNKPAFALEIRKLITVCAEGKQIRVGVIKAVFYIWEFISEHTTSN